MVALTGLHHAQGHDHEEFGGAVLARPSDVQPMGYETAELRRSAGRPSFEIFRKAGLCEPRC